MASNIDTRLLMRRIDVLEAKARRYEREIEAMPIGVADDARSIMQGICADIYDEQRALIACANELSSVARDYLDCTG